MQNLQSSTFQKRSLFYRPEIDGLRALAVLSVVFYHSSLPGIPGGFAGVDVFFVISGFLITQLLLREHDRTGRISILRFYERRVRRLLPALYAMLFVTTVAVLIFYAPSDLVKFSQSLAASVIFASNFFFWRTTSGYFTDNAEVAPLLHTWSLAVEEQFYLFWPIVIIGALWIIARINDNKQKKLLFLTIVFFFISLGLSIWASINFARPSFYMLPTRAFELLLGAILAMLPIRAFSNAIDDIVVAVGLVLVLSSFLLLDSTRPWPGGWALWPCIGTGLIVWGGAKSRIAKVFLANRIFVFIGKISYSWYLWHWPAFAIHRYVTFREPDIQESLIIIMGSFVVASIFWAGVEQPLRHKKGSSTWRTFAILGICPAIVFVMISAAIQVTNGLPARFNADVVKLSQTAVMSPTHRECLQVMRDRNALPMSALCTRNNGPKKILLWGDSHANHYAPALFALAAAEGLTVRQVTKGGCPPLLDVSYVIEPPLFVGECQQFNENVLAEISNDSSVSEIWITGWWKSYLANMDGDVAKLSLILSKTIKDLESRGYKVFVLGATPNFPFEASDCAVRRAQFPSFGISCALDESEHADILKMDHALADVAGDRYFKLTDILCDDVDCNVTLDGQGVYLDSNHLNATFSKWLGENHLTAWYKNK